MFSKPAVQTAVMLGLTRIKRIGRALAFFLSCDYVGERSSLMGDTENTFPSNLN